MARAPRQPQADVQPGETPVRIRLLRPYGYHDAEVHRFWRQGLIVDNMDDVALLKGRGAAYEILE